MLHPQREYNARAAMASGPPRVTELHRHSGSGGQCALHCARNGQSATDDAQIEAVTPTCMHMHMRMRRVDTEPITRAFPSRHLPTLEMR
jgi:bacterioferritin-associated ferredoxin